MKNILPPQSSRRGSRLVSLARALPAVLALAALAVPTRSLAQVPTFNTLQQTWANLPFGFVQSAAVADFNGDGKLDTIITDGGSTLRVMLGNGDGTFSEHDLNLPWIGGGYSNFVGFPSNLNLSNSVATTIDGYGIIKAADVNGDGLPDLVCITGAHLPKPFGSPLWFATVFTNTGTTDANGVPQFTVAQYYSVLGISRSLTVGDLNGDGKPDFIAGDAYGNFQTFLNDGHGNFTGQPNYFNVVPNNGGPSTGPGVIVDVNGDGKADFIESSGQAAATNIFLGNGDGTFQAPVVIQLPGAAPGAIASADLNDDGKPDFAEALSDGSVAVFLNNGNGTYGAPTKYLLPPTVNPSDLDHINIAASVALTDLNGDGKLDLVAGYQQGWYASRGVAVYLGNGDGTFSSATIISLPDYPYEMSVNDFTGDGKPDIGMALYNGRAYGVLTNTTVVAPPLPTQTLTILGGNGSFGAVAANVEYYNPATGNWQPAYLVGQHPWGEVAGTNSWINYRPSISSDAGAGPTTNQTLWYLYRVRFTVPSDAVDPHMTFAINADNFSQVAINGVTSGGSTQFINNANVNNVIVGGPNHGNVQLNADAVFSQNVHPGENTITINVGDWGGANGFNFRIDLSMKSGQPIVIVPATPPDTTPPVITAPATITKEATSGAGAVVTFTATANDAVSGNASVTASPQSGSTFPIGISSVSLSATDAAGNIAHVGIVVTVQDTTAPVVTAPANVVAEATSASGAAVSYPAASATDAVGVTSTAYSAASGSTFPLGTTTVNITAKDNAGNKGTGSFTVTVQDTTPPAITSVPANITAEATSASGATVTYAAATATDAVGVSSIAYSQNSGTTFALGTTTVTVTAKDAAGNSSSKTFTVTVRDTTAPAIASVTPSSATLWPPNHQMVAITVNAIASDAVGVASLKIIGVTSNEPDNGLGDGDTPNDIQITGNLTVNLRAERSGGGNGRTYTITVEARDAAGNASTKTCTVSVPKSQGGK